MQGELFSNMMNGARTSHFTWARLVRELIQGELVCLYGALGPFHMMSVEVRGDASFQLLHLAEALLSPALGEFIFTLRCFGSSL